MSPVCHSDAVTLAATQQHWIARVLGIYWNSITEPSRVPARTRVRIEGVRGSNPLSSTSRPARIGHRCERPIQAVTRGAVSTRCERLCVGEGPRVPDPAIRRRDLDLDHQAHDPFILQGKPVMEVNLASRKICCLEVALDGTGNFAFSISVWVSPMVCLLVLLRDGRELLDGELRDESRRCRPDQDGRRGNERNDRTSEPCGISER